MGETRKTNGMDITTKEISKKCGLDVGGVLYRAKSAGISPVYSGGRYWFTKIQADAIINYQSKNRRKKSMDYDKVISEFKKSKLNTAIVLSAKLNIPFYKVNVILDRYFENAVSEMTTRYEIIESKMNFEDFE